MMRQVLVLNSSNIGNYEEYKSFLRVNERLITEKNKVRHFAVINDIEYFFMSYDPEKIKGFRPNIIINSNLLDRENYYNFMQLGVVLI